MDKDQKMLRQKKTASTLFRYPAFFLFVLLFFAIGCNSTSNSADDSNRNFANERMDKPPENFGNFNPFFRKAYNSDNLKNLKLIPANDETIKQQRETWDKIRKKEDNIKPYSITGQTGYGNGNPDKAKVLLLGLDGVTWKILTPLLEKGLLPNFKKLLTKSSYGWMATDEACSPVSWTSISTGKQKAKWMPENFFGLPWTLQSQNLMAKRLWDILAKPNGSNLAIVNYYFTPQPKEYPKAILFHNEPRLSYPPELFSFLDEHTAAVPLVNGFDPALEAVKKVINESEFEVLASIIRSPDVLQHECFFFFSKKHLFDSEKLEYIFSEMEQVSSQSVKELETIYGKIDDLIGDIMTRFPEDYLFIVSDHGFQTISPRIYIHLNQAFLKENGFDTEEEIFKPEIDGQSHTSEVRFLDTPLIATTGWARYHLPFLEKKSAHRIPLFNTIYSGRIEFLHSHPDKKISKSLFKKMKRAFEKGNFHPFEFVKIDYKDGAVIVDIPEQIVKAHHLSSQLGLMGNIGPLVIRSDFNFHFPEDDGIIIASGPGIAKGRIINKCKLFDVTPTILYMKGKPLGKDMTGKIIQEMIDPKQLASNPVQWIEKYEDEKFLKNRRFEYRELGKDEADKLRGLGYIQ